MDPDPANIIFLALLVLVLMAVNAFFAMSELAVLSASESMLERLAAGGNKKARRAVKLKKDPSKLISITQLGTTLASFLAAAIAAQAFTYPLLGVMERRVGDPWLGVLNIVITLGITLILTYLNIVLGELIPRRVALKHPQEIAMGIAGALAAAAAILRPLVWIVSASAKGLLRLFGFDPDAPEELTVEEIISKVDQGNEQGVIEETQHDMIQNIFKLDDTDVGGIMTHRTDIISAEVTDSLESLVATAIAEGVSRVPVFEEDIDNVIGVVYVKDLLKFVGEKLPKGTCLRELMRPAVFVPETKHCDELFNEMTAKKVQIAIVVDEHGGTAGLVTLEDVLESIVGSIQDEYDNEDEDIEQVDDHTFRLDGATLMEEVEESLGVKLPEGNYDTIAGFVISELGYLPQEGEQPEVQHEHLRFVVEEVEDKRVAMVRVEIAQQEGETE